MAEVEIEKKLGSGAVLKFNLAPFKEAKALYQAVLEEAKVIDLGAKVEMTQVMKDLICIAFSSKKVESALNECLKRARYNELKIDEKTFEPASAREDYTEVCFLVAKENIAPFLKSLMQSYSHILEMIESTPA